MLMGEQGSAKTTMINAHLKKYDSERHVLMASNFSSTTTPQLFQKQVRKTFVTRCDQETIQKIGLLVNKPIHAYLISNDICDQL